MSTLHGVSEDFRDGVVPVASSVSVHWYVGSPGKLVRWSWENQGEPALDVLGLVRQPRSSARSRHIPVTAYSMTNRGHVCLESGLEHDLLRRVDRDPRVRRIVSQPFRLSWTGVEEGTHVPDLLTAYSDGAVTVWDVRALAFQDEDFWRAAAVTKAACDAVGWRYEVFAGLGEVERLNLLWLHGFRQQKPWLSTWEEKIRAICAEGATLGDCFALDDGTGEALSAVWHLVWKGVLRVDLCESLTQFTPVSLSEVGDD